MSLKIDKIQLQIIIDNDESRKRLADLEGDIKKYTNELKKLASQGKQGTKEYIDATKNLQSAQHEYDQIIDKIGLAGLTMKELIQRQKELNAILKNIPPTHVEYKKMSEQLQQVNGRIHELKGQTSVAQKTTESFGSKLGKMADGFNRYFGMATAAIAAFSGIAFSFTTIISGNAKLSDSFADIQKTTGMTAVEVKTLNAELGKIDTRTSREELRQIAVVAGQLGIAKNDIFSFTDSIDKLTVALGDEFTGGAQQVADEVGKLRNILGDTKTGNVSQDLLHIGNALNVLGAEGAATAPVVADFANRIGGIGITLGLTSGQVLGLSATLQELNVNTERGGTATTKILQKMTTDTAAFAKVAGMSVQDFTNLVNNDLFGAFSKVIEGSKKSGDSATALGRIIDSLGIDGAGASEVFSKLGNNTELLSKKVNTATDSLKGTNSIMNEFGLKNDNLAGKVEKLQKVFNSAFNNPEIAEGLGKLVDYMTFLIKENNSLKDSVVDIKKAFSDMFAATDKTAGKLGLYNQTVKDSFKFTDILAAVLDSIVAPFRAMADYATVFMDAWTWILSGIQKGIAIIKDASLVIQELFTFDTSKISASWTNLTDTIFNSHKATALKFRNDKSLADDMTQPYRNAINDIIKLQEGLDARLSKKLGKGLSKIMADSASYNFSDVKTGGGGTGGGTNTTKTNEGGEGANKEFEKELEDRNKIAKQKQDEYAKIIADGVKQIEDDDKKRKAARAEAEKLIGTVADDFESKLVAIDNEEAAKFAKLKEWKDKQTISDAEYEQGKTNATRIANQERMQLVQESFDKINAIAQAASNFFAELKGMELKKVETVADKELAKIQKNKDRELKLAGDDAEKKKAIEERYAAEEAALKTKTEDQKKAISKKYANIEFATKFAQIVASTAVAVMQGFAQLGPIGGAIAGAIITATGMLQLMVAKKQRDEVMGLEYGGEFPVTRAQDGKRFNARMNPSQRGFIDRPTVLVGEHNKREYVVSNAKLQNPFVKQLVDIIDITPSISSKQINLSYMRSAATVQGYEQGGYTSSNSSISSGNATTVIATDPEVRTLLSLILQQVSRDQKAYVNVYELGDAFRKMNELENESTIRPSK